MDYSQRTKELVLEKLGFRPDGTLPDLGEPPFRGTYQLQAWFSQADVDNGNGMVICEHSTDRMSSSQARHRTLEVAHWLVEHGCHKARIVAMPYGVHPRDFQILYEAFA